MKKVFIVLIFCFLVLFGCSGASSNTFLLDEEGGELKLKQKISGSSNADWDNDDLKWFKCDIFYYRSVVGLVVRQRSEDSGYIVFDTYYQLYYFTHALDDNCDAATHGGRSVGCINLNNNNLIKVVIYDEK